MASAFALNIDSQTVLLAAKGKRMAQRRLYEAFYSPVMQLALAVALNPDDARDLVQDAFIKAFDHLEELKDATRFGPWLKTLALNLAMDRLRGHKPTLALDDEVLLPDWDASADGLARLDDLEALLMTLPQLERALVWLHSVEGFEHRELASMLEMKEAAVRQRYRRALAKLAVAAQRRGWQDAG
ncbi:RNA polymerase sigma factor [Gallaecimonas kandeliae]|uniref:RNA polymerase sigma factor n=1 Tax=Gallaecimonas kandeliae TaxID=3029055 RepID=UPI002647AFA8|nr:RNA polymerase sigma factor [Gallaecimonas kandeliae]WKE65720.1 RNA polymerase sigma factor [Gallaecimonas kandeliae]